MAKKKAAKGKRPAKVVLPPTPQEQLLEAAPVVSEPPSYDIKEISAAVASLTTVPKPVLAKLCRLCESKDGPFLNIFDSEKIIAKKINRLLPVMIDEYDKLPHKICFRCSAKVEELYEFVERCIRTQDNLKKNLGESRAAIARKNWEEKLKESQTTNDDYCEILVKQALEKIGVVPDVNPPEALKLEKPQEPVMHSEPVKTETPQMQKKRSSRNKLSFSPDDNQPLKSATKEDGKPYPVRSTRSKIELPVPVPEESSLAKGRQQKSTACSEPKQLPKKDIAKVNPLVGMVIKEKPEVVPPSAKYTLIESDDDDVTITDYKKNVEAVEITKNNTISPKPQESSNGLAEKIIHKQAKVNEKSIDSISETGSADSEEIDIMQHISTIKVGGAGLLYQCKLCKRNFLKKEVILGHNCARARQELAKIKKPEMKLVNNASHDDLITKAIVQKLQQKSLTDKEIIEAFKLKNSQTLSVNSFAMDYDNTPPKPKPGPASKKKLNIPTAPPHTATPPSAPAPLLPPTGPAQIAPVPSLPTTSVELPSGILSTKNRFKLVPGPNNTYTLIEDTLIEDKDETIPQMPPRHTTVKVTTPKQKDDIISIDDDRPNDLPPPQPARIIPTYNHNYPNLSSAETHRFPNYQALSAPPQQSASQQQQSAPYPVGLFQTIPRGTPTQPPPFSTPAMKKQSYTIVQTGHPSKLLISTKPTEPPPVSATAGKTRKGRKTAEPPKQPFQVTLEDSAPHKAQSDNFFTFVNVDPLLQPSYVLPTETIIQESQITTSTTPSVQSKKVVPQQPAEIYSCELCPMKFTREKKLLTHLQTHYVKIDEDEDYTPTPKKKLRRS